VLLFKDVETVSMNFQSLTQVPIVRSPVPALGFDSEVGSFCEEKPKTLIHLDRNVSLLLRSIQGLLTVAHPLLTIAQNLFC
jgi:hypothetical protein